MVEASYKGDGSVKCTRPSDSGVVSIMFPLTGGMKLGGETVK